MSLKPPVAPNVAVDNAHVFDESTALPVRDGLVFTGAGVTATDDSNNDRTIVTIPGGAGHTIQDEGTSLPARTNLDFQGAGVSASDNSAQDKTVVTISTAAGSEPYQVVDALSGTPRSVSDWGPLLNSAIAGGTRRFLFGPYDYPFTTQLNLSGKLNVIFEGAGGSSWNPATGTDGFTRLLWGGTGASAAVDATGANANVGTVGMVFRDLALLYTSASFTGFLVDGSNGTLHTYERVNFGSTQATVSAAAAVSLRNINTAIFDNCVFNGFVSHVAGVTSGTEFSNVVHFRDCTFQGICTQYALNPNHDWRFSHCTFEMVPGSGAGNMQYGITTTVAGIAGGSEIALDDCDWWDGGGGTIKGVYIPSTNANGVTLTVTNCRDHNGAGAFARIYDHQGPGVITILGGNAASKIDVGDAAVNKKTDITILGLGTGSGTDKNMILNANSGHANVNISVNKGGPNLLGTSGQIATLAHERTLRVDQPTIAAHTGVTGHTFNIYGTDMAGWITIQNSSGGTGPTGLLADITLAVSPTGSDVQGSTNGGTSFQLPLVQIWPFQPDDSGSSYASPNMGTTWTCQPYAYAKSARVAGNQLSFSIGVNVGIPNGGLIGVGYRVIHL